MYTILPHKQIDGCLVGLQRVRVKYIAFKKYLGIQYGYELA